MPGMRCDGCGHLRVYNKPVVVVRDGSAWVESERTPPRNEVRVLRFHESCYEAARVADPALPVILGSERGRPGDDALPATTADGDAGN